ncbi:thioredoxin fold domain-containing protein [Saprospiraceae bacterium]|nr:thioredoxin fold domain-containing protein [Saprospiraceae bacterium]
MKRIIFITILLLFAVLGFSQNKYSVYVFVAEKCPISIYMAKPLQEAFKKYGSEVSFYAVFPMKNSTEATAQKFLEKYKLTDFKIKLDNHQGFARKLKATITPEIVVLNEKGEVAFRGRISDAYKAPGKMKHGVRKNELMTILENLTSGKTVPKPWAEAVGCYITFHN